jgi:hypothetical protein
MPECQTAAIQGEPGRQDVQLRRWAKGLSTQQTGANGRRSGFSTLHRQVDLVVNQESGIDAITTLQGLVCACRTA